MNINDFEENILPTILANKITAKAFLKMLEVRGVEFSISIDEMSHSDCIRAASMIYATLKVKEKQPKQQEKGK